LTGAPCEQINHEELNAQELWAKIFPADKVNYTMCCSVTSSQDFSSVGLVNSHAYTLVGCFEY